MNKKQLASFTLAAAVTFASFIGVADAKSAQYKVKSGDSLWKISRANSVTVANLKEWNHLKSDTILVGQKLYVVKPDSTKKSTKTTKSTKKNSKASTAKTSNTYIVKSGDSLYKIAKKHKTTVKEIKRLNKLKSDLIIKGQKLIIKDNSSKSTKEEKKKATQPTKKKETTQQSVQNNSKNATYHTIKSGETLWIIATKYGTSVSQLKTWNGLKSDLIYSGQELKVSEGTSKTPKAPSFLKDGKFPLKQGTYYPYGDTWNDSRTYGGSRGHEGVDIMADIGTPVYSVTAGEIERYGWNELGGWRMTIKTADGYHLYYAHMSKYAKGLANGAKVKKGQLIGYVGNTGYGPEGTSGKFDSHLHFGMYDKNWDAMNPYQHLKYWEVN